MKSVDPTVLVVAPDCPWPPNHGGRVDVWRRLLSLRELGLRIDLAITVGKPPEPEHFERLRRVVDRVWLVPRVRSLKSVCTSRPFQVESRLPLRDIDFPHAYDLAILEGHYVWHVLSNPTLQCKQIALRVHNDETVYHRKLAAAAGLSWRAADYWLESLRFAKLEPKIRERVGHFLCISADEARRLSSTIKRGSCRFLPMPIAELHAPSIQLPAPESHARRVLFVGSLFMVNNRAALTWYCEQVHPRLASVPGYQFVVAGNTRGSLDPSLSALFKCHRVEFHDSPANLRPIYESCQVFVNPMQHGAGVKVKTIEALCNGLAVVTTSTGCEGTFLADEKHVQIADSPETFAGSVAATLTSAELRESQVARAQDFLRERYDQTANLREFLESISIARPAPVAS